MQKRRLTDRTLRSLKHAQPGKRYDVMDGDVRGFGVRVTDRGQRTFVLIARYPGSQNPTRRALGEYPRLSLESARKKAQRWHALISEGKDPHDEEEKVRLSELRKKAETFEAAVEEYAKRVLQKQRRGRIVERELRQVGKHWSGRAITSIGRHDVIEEINRVLDRGATYQAHNLFGHIRGFFNWAVEDGRYGLEHSPCDRIRPKRLIGERKARQRVLTDDELRALWGGTEGMGYPFGPLFQLLLLTACRKNEIGGARWREIDLGKRLLIIRAERFKSDATHLVPLTGAALSVLETLPRFTKGDHLFSSTFGEKPVSGFAGAKDRLDKLMANELGGELQPAPGRYTW